MKTKQEQIEKLAQLIGRIKDDCENCDCKSCEVNGEDCCCVHYICATFLVDAGYGDVSEYKAEREMLGSQIKVLKQRLNNKYVEIEQLKYEFNQLQTNAEILAQGVRDFNHENYELTEKVKQARADTINTIVKYCENPNHWRELKDCKLWGGKSDDLRNFLSGIFKEVDV